MPKKTFELAEAAAANLVVQLKGNQRKIHQQVKNAHKRAKPISCHEDDPVKSHGRIEERRYEVFEASDILGKWKEEWRYVRRIIKVTRRRERLLVGSRMTEEVSFYLTNAREGRADQYATVIRNHWGIENGSNYVRDMAFTEDGSVRRVNPGIFARLISAAYNLISISGSKNFRGSLYENSLSFQKIMNASKFF